MSTYACKVLTTDREFFYVGYNTTSDQFVTPTLPTTEDVGRACGVVLPTEVDREHVFDLRRQAIHRAVLHLAKLKLGKSLTVKEACELERFEKFLSATVAPHQYNYPAVDESVVEKWAKELGLGKKFLDCGGWEMVTDNAMFPAFQDAVLRKRYPRSYRDRRKRPTPAQNKLAGRYLSALAMIANIVGPKKSSPAEIVERFFKKFQQEE